jgi:trehalose/maltose hydrolase-like predicted phosphorylase
MAAAREVLQRHYLGLTLRADGLEFNPRVPDNLAPLDFAFRYRGDRYRLNWDGAKLCLSSDHTNVSDQTIVLQGERHLLAVGQSLIISAPSKT